MQQSIYTVYNFAIYKCDRMPLYVAIYLLFTV